jgi:spore maturation protein SpmA
LLNYVWLGLIILGFISALYIDTSDKITNRFKNDVPLSCNIRFNNSNEKTNKIKVIVSSENFSKFYSTSVSNDIIVEGKLNAKLSENEYLISIPSTQNLPKIWKEMVSSLGKENALTARLKIISNVEEDNYLAKLTISNVEFITLKKITNESIKIAGVAVEIAIGLIGIMAMWLGVMKIAEEAGLIKNIAKFIKPLTKKIFPEVPPNHPAIGSMVMNISANMLGLGNAATPFGLKAMEELDSLNPNKGTATNSMITFLAINTAGLTLIPATAIAIRAASGSTNPTIIIGTTIFAAFCATLTGLLTANLFHLIFDKKKKFNSIIKEHLRGILISIFLLISIVLFFILFPASFLDALVKNGIFNIFKKIVEMISIIAIPSLIVIFVGYGALKKIKVYEQFVEGAKEGFNIAIRIIPYLVAMLVAIAIFRAGGAMDNWLIPVLRNFTDLIGMPAEALPMALMRPLSGSGSLGIMAEIMSVYGPDSFIGILVSTFYGSTETTFYVLSVYFGAVNIKNTRYALPVGLLADIAGILAALFIVSLLYG